MKTKGRLPRVCGLGWVCEVLGRGGSPDNSAPAAKLARVRARLPLSLESNWRPATTPALSSAQQLTWLRMRLTLSQVWVIGSIYGEHAQYDST